MAFEYWDIKDAICYNRWIDRMQGSNPIKELGNCLKILELDCCLVKGSMYGKQLKKLGYVRKFKFNLLLIYHNFNEGFQYKKVVVF